jgi:type I restriction enzyme S subunit
LIETFYRGAGIQHPSMFKVLTMPLPVLSIEKQSRIVSILDTFEASIQNLEAQLKEREKQYEYYRNKLLTFE